MLKKSAVQSLRAKINNRKSEEGTYENDPAELFECGDFLNPEHGGIFIIRKEQEDGAEADPGEPVYSMGPKVAKDSGFSPMKYEVVVSYSPEQPVPRNFIASAWVPWQNALYIPTDEEQIKILAEIFPDELIRWAFARTGLLSPSMKGQTIYEPPTEKAESEQTSSDGGTEWVIDSNTGEDATQDDEPEWAPPDSDEEGETGMASGEAALKEALDQFKTAGAKPEEED
jgi:hypothetical protein